jgi:cbb3-type cytochrome oxidase maturation protein
MYVIGWVGLVIISLGIMLSAFVWAVKTGQFNDQQRLRYLPLRDEPPAVPVVDPARRPLEVRVLIGIGMVVAAMYLTAIVIAVT